MTTATPPPPSPPITAADLLAAACRHRLTLARGRVLVLGPRRCCAIGALAVLFDPELARDGDSSLARRVVRSHIGVDAIVGIEDGFEGRCGHATYTDPDEFYHWRAIGEALAREAGVDSGDPALAGCRDPRD